MVFRSCCPGSPGGGVGKVPFQSPVALCTTTGSPQRPLCVHGEHAFLQGPRAPSFCVPEGEYCALLSRWGLLPRDIWVGGVAANPYSLCLFVTLLEFPRGCFLPHVEPVRQAHYFAGEGPQKSPGSLRNTSVPPGCKCLVCCRGEQPPWDHPRNGEEERRPRALSVQ